MIRRIAAMLLALLIILSFAACGADTKPSSGDGNAKTEYRTLNIFAMNTYVTMRLSTTAADGHIFTVDEMDAINEGCILLLGELESVLSVTLEESDIFRLNSAESGITDADPATVEVLARALEIAKETGGTFTPAIRTVTALWDVVNGGYVPTDKEIAEALAHTDYTAVSVNGNAVSKTDPAVQVDLGAIGKGYAAEKLIDYLVSAGITEGLVSLGGNVGVFGENAVADPFTVGIADPSDTSAVSGYLTLPAGFVSVSGDYERYFEKDGVKYHHIMDPKTGRPAASGLRSAAVVSEDGTLADALSTALFVMGAENALTFYDSGVYEFEAILITDDGRIIVTPGLADTFTLADGVAYTLTVHGK